MITENESTEEQKRKARRMARAIKSPGVCALCGRKKSYLERHHWKGYEPPFEENVIFICKHANLVIAEHDGTPIEYIRKRYLIQFTDQPTLFEDEICGMEKRFNELRAHYCKWFVNWAVKFTHNFPKRLWKQKEWFFNNVEKVEGTIGKIRARQVMYKMTEDEIWDLGQS